MILEREYWYHWWYRNGKHNPADYLSRHLIQLKFLSLEDRVESRDLSSQCELESVYKTAALDVLSIRETVNHTKKDPIFCQLKDLTQIRKYSTFQNICQNENLIEAYAGNGGIL